GHEDAGNERVDRWERAQHLRERGVETDLLVRLAERGRDEGVIPRLREPAREGHLSRMPAEVGRPLGEQQRRRGLLDQQHQHGGEPLAGVGLGLGIRVEPFAQRRAMIRERHGLIVGDRPANAAPDGRARTAGSVPGVTEVDDVRSPAADAAAAAVDVDDLLGYARALIAAPSENPGGTEDEAASVAADILASLGATPEIVRGDEGRPSVVARFGDRPRPSLAWNGHLDTVPAGSPDAWTTPPFDGEIRDGKLIGRGACDMKGAIAAALASAAAIARVGVPLGGSLWFHLVADEELAGIHGTKVLWEHGMLDQDAAIVGEPTELQLGMAQRGGAWITAAAHGKAAHG